MIERMSVRRRLVASTAALAVGVALMVTVTVPGSLSAYIAKVTNSINTVTTNPYFTCGDADRARSPYATFPLGPAIGTQALGAVDVSGQGRTGTYTTTGITYGVQSPCPRDAYSAITLDGSSGAVSLASNPILTTTLTSFSEEIWFQTSTAGGKLIGLGDAASPNTGSGNNDRHVYLNGSGQLVFGVFPNNTLQTVTSPSTYTDNKWHHVVATQGATGSTYPGMRLYVDGSLVASAPTVTTAQLAYTGYLRIGYDTVVTWPGATTGRFTGSLAWASFNANTVLSPADVASHYAAGTAAVPVTQSNLALGKTATQSSTAFNGPPSLAVDGNTDAVYSDGSSSHTDYQATPWWQVDLGASRTVARIELWNRLASDCCADRLTNYWVFASASPFNTALTPTAQAATAGVWSSLQTTQAGNPTAIAVGTNARYVMVQLAGTNYLTLPEVQVIGT